MKMLSPWALFTWLCMAVAAVAEGGGAPAPVADPVAAYRRECLALVGEHWKELIDPKNKRWVVYGWVKVAFEISRGGLAENVQVLEESERGEPLRRLALRAVEKSRFKPIPVEVLAQLKGKPLRVQGNFMYWTE